MAVCHSMNDVFAFAMEREVKACNLYRFAASGVSDPGAKELLDRLVQRCETYLEKLESSRRQGIFHPKPCSLPDRAFHETIVVSDASPGHSVAEILMFAIKAKQDGYQLFRKAVGECADPEQKRLWLALAEEERTQRLELESYYEKEVIGRI